MATPGVQTSVFGSGTAESDCVSGQFYTVFNTTPGTGIAGHAAPTSSDKNKPCFYLYNGGPGVIIPKYLRCRVTAAGAGATTTDAAIWLDDTRTAAAPAGTLSYSSGGTLMAQPANCNASYQRGSGGICYIGAVVPVSTANVRQVSAARIRSVVPVVEDQYFFTFGATNAVDISALATTGTAQLVCAVPMAAVVIGPGGVFELVIWGTTQSGAHSFDFECGFVERL